MHIEEARGHTLRIPLIAFRECLNLAITGIELDVHLSKDGKLIVMHDDFIDRTTNGKGEIRNYTLAELKNLMWVIIVMNHKKFLRWRKYLIYVSHQA